MPEWWETPTSVAVGGSANLPATNELKIDMHSKVMTAFPALTPVTSMLTRLGSDGAHNFRIDWQEENRVPTTIVVGTQLAAAGTSLVPVANAKTLVRDTLLFNPRTFDLATVDTTPTSDTAATITRSEGGTTAAIWLAGDILHVLPPAIAENDANYRTVSVADSNVYNLMQICKLQYALTRLEDKMATQFGGPGWKRDRLKAQKYYEARVKWEKLIYFGGRASSGTAPATQRMMGGFVHYLRNGTLYKDFNSVFTETGFDNWLGDYWDQNPDSQNVVLFCAGNVKRLMGYWGKNKIRLSPLSKKYGFRIDNYIGGNFDVPIVPLPLLTDPVTKGWMWLLDLDRMRLRTVDPMMFYPEALNVGESEVIYDTYRVVTSLLLANESRQAMAVGALV